VLIEERPVLLLVGGGLLVLVFDVFSGEVSVPDSNVSFISGFFDFVVDVFVF
jgi:hypothetical protein